jgi:hypothetical protein
VVLKLWDVELEVSTLASLGFKKFYAKIRNGSHT